MDDISDRFPMEPPDPEWEAANPGWPDVPPEDPRWHPGKKNDHGNLSAKANIMNGADPHAPNASASERGNKSNTMPTIRVVAGERHLAADAGLAAMVGAEVDFYQRDRSLVRTALAKAKSAGGSTVEVPGIVPVTIPMLGRALGESAIWEKLVKSGEDENGNPQFKSIRIDPPKEVVEQIAAMNGMWQFRPLSGVISTPTMRPDGSLLLAPGYDDATGLVLMCAPPVPAISDSPTRADADGAMNLLKGLFREFPFADEASRSVALSMALTTVLRGALLPAVPFHVATAPQPGTGKSYLLDIPAAITTGERCGVIAHSADPAEFEKRLVGAALAGQAIIAIDNVSRELGGDFLNQVTERPLLQMRPLGGSTMIRVPNTFTVFANGNNLSAPADLVRRTLVARLDADMENPETRVFSQNPLQMILANRGAYIVACLTIGRAYICAGSPDPCPPLASFEPWSNLVRSALVWLGCADPCLSMELARTEDPTRAARTAFFTAWRDEIGLRGARSVAQLVQEAETTGPNGFLCPNLREACLTVAEDRTGNLISPKRLGKWLSLNKNNRVGDLKLVADNQTAARVYWRLDRVYTLTPP